MQLEALKHIARTALELIGPDSELIVVGSSSLLASAPELGAGDAILSTSYDADLVPDPFSEDVGVMLHEALGEDRRFHRLHGYFADVIRPPIGEQSPPGWNDRLVELFGLPRVKCLDPHDLAAVKCQTGRDKDLDLLVELAKELVIDLKLVEERLRETTMPEARIVSTFRNLRSVQEPSS